MNILADVVSRAIKRAFSEGYIFASEENQTERYENTIMENIMIGAAIELSRAERSVVECALAGVDLQNELEEHKNVEPFAGLADAILDGKFLDILDTIYNEGYADSETGDGKTKEQVFEYARRIAREWLLKKIEEGK